ncbi:MAG: protein-L-isoaspartate(D-aspartate) O-methyltransferase [Victivallales bacterium]|nr:protein-L-isoaspartate(D-aspartate) O-methyltransferase [Victivallales bacterium]
MGFDRDSMISEDILPRGLSNQLVIQAMREVPREFFVPEVVRRSAYCDSPLPIGRGQTISQPYIVALMTELLQPREGSRILEIGTGSGYQAAVLSRIVKSVYSIEIIPELAQDAQLLFLELGYGNIHVRIDDGADGWPEEAPFDGIIVTAAAPTVPDDLKKQLKIGGRLVIPIGQPGDVQQLAVMVRDSEGFQKEPNILVRFVPMTGKCAKKH